jgi:hypothetical protein
MWHNNPKITHLNRFIAAVVWISQAYSRRFRFFFAQNDRILRAVLRIFYYINYHFSVF